MDEIQIHRNLVTRWGPYSKAHELNQRQLPYESLRPTGFKILSESTERRLHI